MDRQALKRMLQQVRSRKIGVEAALDQLRMMPLDDLGFATEDYDAVGRYRETQRLFTEDGEPTGALPGRLVRGPQPAP